jgi:GTP-binding protein HflX
LAQELDDDVIVMRARLDERAIGRLRQAGVRVTVTKSVTRPKSALAAGDVPLP